MLISRKLPLAAALLTIVAIGASSVAALVISSNTLERKAFEKLEAVADGRRNQVETYLKTVEKDLRTLVADPEVGNAFSAFKFGWRYMEGDAVTELQKRYIDDNPHPAGQKHLLDTADVDGYDSIHKKYHDKLRQTVLDNGYYDLFLIDEEGNVVYTVFKERDFATNLMTGEWKDTDLANVYREVMEAGADGQLVLKDFRPYGPSNGAPAAFIGMPFVIGKDVAGVVVLQMPNDIIAEIMNNTTGLGETGETILIRNDGFLISDSAKTEENESLVMQLDTPLIGEATRDRIVTGHVTGYRGFVGDVAFAQVDFGGSGWVVGAIIDQSEALAGVTSLRNIVLLIALALLAAAMAAAILFSRSITRPISDVVRNMSELARGNTDLELKGEARKDEIGEMVRSVAVFRDAAIEKENLEREAEENRSLSDRERAEREAAKAEEARQMQEAVEALAGGLTRLSEGDLTVSIDTPFMEALERLRVDFNASIEKLNGTLCGIRESTGSIDNNSMEMRSAADDLSRRTEQQAASLEESSAALEEITSAVKGTTERAGEAAQMAEAAQTDAEKSSAIVSEAVSAMEGIESASAEISNIINVIDEIAFQTNLLALNAGVEAARAGEAGKGFAVVAQEVRELAQRAATAAQEIKELITKSGEQVGNGVKMVKATGDALTQISEHVTNVNNAIGAIATAANEQLTGIQEVNAAVTQMDQMTQQNAAMVEETTAVTHQLAQDVTGLSGRIGEFLLCGDAPAASVKEADETSEHVPSPARKMVKAVSSALGFEGNAAKTADEDQNWDEF
ncbi:methyl-accepting chemotaxis protein [Hoeflea poritis]|uniref:Methyl-accepting chemotaxis protein n=1 Tax=Hoeflea poritis TaxID=2993659 RepID=A0ABT4VVU2_9HYPH|nr:methyl-accepting chemotaxis protein [Hoeflea poritis]MDA4848821.1 methyl-accepting chemotaxis protein [Hoeflea poritis]